MIVWWKINLNKENASLDELFRKKADKVIEITSIRSWSEMKNDKYALFYKGGA
ncbi:MAG: hypothetical protein IPL67_19455 [Ignavibacteria bacterium]|nr:hypothetical protein [Ignavibacteria bacterium]